jgi:hypothetical protein
MSERIKTIISIFAGVPFALVYGGLARWFFGSNPLRFNENGFGTLSLAFLFLVPVAIGALTVFFAPAHLRASWVYALFMPWLSSFIAALVAGVLALEAAICIAMALPILIVMASGGGLITFLIFKRFAESANTTMLSLVLLAPFVFAPIESQFPVTDSYRTVHTQIEIAASPESVWRNIIRVAPIQDNERTFSWLFDMFGAPKPQEATLESERVGVMRQGKFAGGLFFHEKIVVWQPNERLDFEITADNQIPHNTLASLAPWSEIGGQYFAVPVASYHLEPIGNGKLILHLNSTHRLTTRFNDYGGVWTDWGMREFQNQILYVVKARAEAQK